ncbi:MAG: phosphoglucosamine mutase [Candidatus Micrarchaeota archaeon]
MFGTSGIRGVYGKDVTEALAQRIASIFAEGRLVIGRDIRGSGPSLLKAVSAGAMDAGSDAIDLGIVPTPTVALATRLHGCRGIALTASHNPPEYNGLKLIEGSKEIGKALEKEITGRYGQGSVPKSAARGSFLHDRTILDEHRRLVIGMVDADAIAKKRPKVIVDCNGAGCVITPYLLSDLGCRVISVNGSTACFNRPSEPNAANLAYLSSFVRGTGADFAIAHDGDGDRCVVLDEAGAALPFDAQLAMMIEHELEGGDGKGIVSTVEASLTVRDAVERKGGKIEITPVGSTYVADMMEERGSLFGGEPCGEYIYRDGVHVPDAVLAAAKFAEMFCLKGRFSAQKARFPQNFMARERFPSKDKKGAVERIRGRLDIDGVVRSDDGVRVDEEDGWFLIRASGTEPIVRLTMEYKDRKKLEERKARLVSLIKSSL